LDRVVATQEAATAGCRHCPCERACTLWYGNRRARCERSAAQTAALSSVRQRGDSIARQRGIGGDDRFDLVPLEGIGYRTYARAVEIGRNLHRQRHVPAVRLREVLLLALEHGEQPVELVPPLQLAQPLSVGRRDVDRYVARDRVHFAQAIAIVVSGMLEWRLGVLADVDPQHAAVGGVPDVFDET